MSHYLTRRLLAAGPTVVGITVLIFLAMRVLPGDPIALIQSESAGNYVLDKDQLAAARHSLGLDQPYYLQYLTWVGNAIRGNFGTSFWTNDPINQIIFRRAPISAEIAFLAFLISLALGVPVGLLSAVKRNSWLDNLARVLATIFMAIPSFWIGLVIVLLGIVLFTWRPSLTIIYFWNDPLHNAQMVIGPAVALGLGLGAVTIRLTRAATLEVLGEDYVRTARAKGLMSRVVVFRHVFKNAMLPVVTASGLALGGLLGGSVSVETAFGVPGLGTLLVQALNARDWNMIQALVLLYGIVFTLINLTIDLLYAVIDPRIRYQ
jgi:peptide/nickel transport system permease protein